MSGHQHTSNGSHGSGGSVERHCDVVVVGGSAAGLAAALQLGRQRRSVIVIDSGEPRNAPAAHAHSYLGHEGTPPGDLTAIGREEVRSYGVEVLTGSVVEVTRIADGRFRAELAGGASIVARRVLAATGLVDELPHVEGLADHWGTDVIHCPFCHGYEVRDRRVVQILTHPMGLHPSAMFRQLTDRFTLLLHEGVEADAAGVEALRAAGVEVVEGGARRILTGEDGRLVGVETLDGARIDADAVVVTTRFSVRATPFDALGVRRVAHPSGLGGVVEVDATGQTSVPGVYAAGNVVDPGLQVIGAAAAGSRAGGTIAADLAHRDLEAASHPPAHQADWDHRYGGGRMWSGNPNGTLVGEVSDLEPGSVLDVGAGEGGDALWLAERGWKVTAADISTSALGHVDERSRERGLPVEVLHADANALDPFGGRTFDLVSAQYASIPRTPDGRGIANVLAAVAPGGMLLVVGHDLEPMRTPIDPRTTSRAFDPDSHVRVEDFAAALADDPGWHVELHEKRPRPPGAASSHHVDDIVLRARRTG